MDPRLKYHLVFGDFEVYFGVNSRIKMIITVIQSPAPTDSSLNYDASETLNCVANETVNPVLVGQRLLHP